MKVQTPLQPTTEGVFASDTHQSIRSILGGLSIRSAGYEGRRTISTDLITAPSSPVITRASGHHGTEPFVVVEGFQDALKVRTSSSLYLSIDEAKALVHRLDQAILEAQ